MSNVEAMQKLYKAITGKATESATVAGIISDLADYYAGSADSTKSKKKGESETS